MVAFVFGTYLWFVLLPMWFNYSFPTGGWDWLGFVGVVGGLFLSVWCLKKQQELSVVPCLDVDAIQPFVNSRIWLKISTRNRRINRKPLKKDAKTCAPFLAWRTSGAHQPPILQVFSYKSRSSGVSTSMTFSQNNANCCSFIAHIISTSSFLVCFCSSVIAAYLLPFYVLPAPALPASGRSER